MAISSIDIALQVRRNFIELMDNMTIGELNTIPSGFNNNIAWNFGHIVVSQQKLCYTLSGLPIKLDEQYMLKYQKGSKPEKFIDQDEIDYLKEQAYTLIDELLGDLEASIFHNFNPTKLHFGLELKGIEDAINYFQNHDALHLGFATAIKRAIIGEKQKLSANA
ncbi:MULTISPECIES: DinB family protein [Olivibacter]|jgi:hypothetical protein|uniref:DinB family protein n=1 Tax=Olivibacter jilunii TaxID=985016 RepID=A0ABW6B489_9SPHI|nr:DinB family protein [Olivibacter jilunii]MCL4640199.1 DinB family protein [Olivibacter sp. UJ_SKK_5.1]MDX3915965.1 DinB family protein [Pseudosphingobacterium sp.]